MDLLGSVFNGTTKVPGRELKESVDVGRGPEYLAHEIVDPPQAGDSGPQTRRGNVRIGSDCRVAIA
jgi:hypothetical protein